MLKLFYYITIFLLINGVVFAKDKNLEVLLKNNENQLTLIDILEIALQNNPKIKEAWLNIDVSKNNLGSQISELFPTINGEISYSNNKNTFENVNSNNTKNENWSPSINLSYLLFNFGGRTADILNFKYKLNAIKYNTNTFVQTFLYSVIEAYYNLFSSISNERASQESENSSYEAFKAASLRYNIGLAPLTDKLQAETSYMQKKLTREKAENSVKIKVAELNYLLNLSPIVKLNLAIPYLNITKYDSDANIESLIEKALKNRPDLKSYYETKKSKKAEIYSKASEWLPSVSLTSSYGRTNDIKNNNDRNNYNVGVSATMPFFTGGYVYSNVARTKNELNIVNQQIRDLEKNIELDVWMAYQDFITAKKTYNTSEVLLKSALETERTMLGRYKNGKSSILDLLNSQSDLANARYENINSQHNWFIKRANLIRALGDINAKELNKFFNSETDTEDIILNNKNRTENENSTN